VLWLIGGNDLIARFFEVQLYWTIWFGRVTVTLGPVIAYIVTKRVCLGLQRKDRELLDHGVETGIIRQLPTGEFIEVTRPVDEDARAAVASRAQLPALPPTYVAAGASRVLTPQTRHGMGRLRLRLAHIFYEAIPLGDKEDNGDGHPGTGASRT
jgi:ubiquinol-cytochrome c reductase cytochrome b subunit